MKAEQKYQMQHGFLNNSINSTRLKRWILKKNIPLGLPTFNLHKVYTIQASYSISRLLLCYIANFQLQLINQI